ncbi:MAG: hypothetical protein ONB25_02710 [candidate division KSB1 bacterium]|nr:hypothetical protein [candidate division KSB1 bacterium]
MKLTKSLNPAAAFFLATMLCVTASLSGQTKGELAANRYVDPKGYFRIVPPQGWSIREYPQDPRGKVAFIAPDGEDYLRVLINVVDFTTIDELVERCKNIESRIGISMNIKKEDFGGRLVVKRSFEMKGLKWFTIDFLVGSVAHNLQFAAPPNLYQKYLRVAMKSMETYEPIPKSTSEKDFIASQVAKKLRLAQLMIDEGNYELALDYIKEGLEFSPQDAKLLELKKQVERKLGIN